MLKQDKYDILYMDIAERVGLMSHDLKYQVGSIIVKDGQILSQGWNGMPSGLPNLMRDDSGVTYPEVIHSEANALMKLARNGGGSEGSTIYCTYSPCWDCATLILQAGIKRVVYKHVYNQNSLEFLKKRIEYARIKPNKRVSIK